MISTAGATGAARGTAMPQALGAAPRLVLGSRGARRTCHRRSGALHSALDGLRLEIREFRPTRIEALTNS